MKCAGRYKKKGKHLAQGPGVQTLLHAEANGALKLLRNSLLNYTIYSRTIESAETRPQKQTVSVVVSVWHSKTSNSNKKLATQRDQEFDTLLCARYCCRNLDRTIANKPLMLASIPETIESRRLYFNICGSEVVNFFRRWLHWLVKILVNI